MPLGQLQSAEAMKLTDIPGVGDGLASLLKAVNTGKPIHPETFGRFRGSKCNRLPLLLKHGLVEWEEVGKSLRLSEKCRTLMQ